MSPVRIDSGARGDDEDSVMEVWNGISFRTGQLRTWETGPQLVCSYARSTAVAPSAFLEIAKEDQVDHQRDAR